MNYVITLKNNINYSDIRRLTVFYQAVIGYDGLSLYLTLFEEQQTIEKLKENNINSSFDLKRLLRITNMNNRSLKIALQKLESLKLLRTYFRKKTQTYNFILYSPIPEENFISYDKILNSIQSKLTDEDINVLHYLAKPINDNEYDDITCSFDIDHDHNALMFENSLDFAIIDQKIIRKGLNPELYMPFKKEIINLADAYNLKEKNIFKFLVESWNKDNVEYEFFDFELFKKLLIKNNSINQNFVSKSTQLKLEINNNEKEQNLTCLDIKIKEMLETNSFLYCRLLLNQDSINDELAHSIIKSKTELKLNQGFINCILEFCYLKNKYINPKYFDKISGTVSKGEFNNILSLMNFLKRSLVTI